MLHGCRGPQQAGATVHKQGSGPNKRPESLVLPLVREPLRGLQDALDELCELLKDSASPVQLVTLTGGSGIGEASASRDDRSLHQGVLSNPSKQDGMAGPLLASPFTGLVCQDSCYSVWLAVLLSSCMWLLVLALQPLGCTALLPFPVVAFLRNLPWHAQAR